MKILIVDDHSYNCEILSCILQDAGHVCVEAKNGAIACEVITADQAIEFVLMDVNMPVMDGYEATRRIRLLTQGRLVTIIFVTGLDNSEVTVKCLEAGGDDFVPKPINQDILLSKISAHNRQRGYFNQLKSANDELLYHQSMMNREHKIVEHVFMQNGKRNDTYCVNVKHHTSSMSLFNGDLVLSSPSPAGGVYILIGDFTGHGLSAAIGSLPVTEIFYDYAAKQSSVAQMARQINTRLHSLLPMGMFFCACIMHLNASGRELSLWSGGMNDMVCQLPGEPELVRLTGDHMPLGILEKHEFNELTQLHTMPLGTRIYVYTDGINEVTNAEGSEFGHAQVERLILENRVDTIAGIVSAVLEFQGASAQSDDFSLVEILCEPVLHFSKTTHAGIDVGAKYRQVESFPWELAVDLTAQDLASIDIVQQLLSLVGSLQGVELHQDKLFIITSELFSNALEHGVLGLDSALKSTPDGFARYYSLREQGLARLKDEFIKLRYQYIRGAPNQIRLTITDSGPGFDYQSMVRDMDTNEDNHGRGLHLLRNLCADLLYSDGGRTVTALYYFD